MQEDYWPFHLFGATFASEAEAQQFVFEQWEPQPLETASDSVYSAWEERNPTWRLSEELGFHMDSDFVELANNPEELIAQIQSPSERERVAATATAFTHLILVGMNAIWGDRRSASTQVESPVRSPESTATFTYLGKFN